MKKVLFIAIILAFIVGLVPANVATASTRPVPPSGISIMSPSPDGTPVVKTLYAGQHIEVGTVTVSDDGVNMTVTYQITMEGWFLTQTHLYVGLTPPKSSAPGKFPYHHDNLYATSDTFVVPIQVGRTYYVAAHSEVLNENNIVDWDCPTVDEVAASLPQYSWINRTPPTIYIEALGGTFYPSWCIDRSHGIYPGVDYYAALFSAHHPIPEYLTAGDNPYLDHPENLDLVLWVTNNRDGYDDWPVQRVIWYLIENNPPEPPLDPSELVLYNAAIANGEGFVPDFAAGDDFSILVAPIEGQSEFQLTMTQFPVECTPIYQEETAWAQGTFFWRTGWGSYFTYIP